MQYRTPSMASNEFYTFWFEKNLQGDIVAVYNEYGDKLISYTYDAWGNFSSSWINLAGTNYYATLNPFHYRGYFYDAESGLYYLQSRYYNPQWGRFISADDVSYLLSESQYTNGNLYVYCNNNPVMYTDPSGHIAFFVVTMLIGAVVVAAAGVAIGHYMAGAEGTDLIYWGVGGALVGAAIGAAIGATISYAATGSATASFSKIKAGFAAKVAKNAVNPQIKEALEILDKSGIKPGQTSISQKNVLDILSNYDSIKAQSAYTRINGSLYVSEGHHTMVANVMKYGYLNSGPNMGMLVSDPSVIVNMSWTSLTILP